MDIKLFLNRIFLRSLYLQDSTFKENHENIFIPVLVETASTVFAQMLGKDGFESSQSLGGFNVSDNPNDHHGRSLQNSDSLDNLLLVGLCDGEIRASSHKQIKVRRTSYYIKSGGKASCEHRMHFATHRQY